MLGFHHFGTFLLFAATILLLVSTISSPVVDRMAIAKASLRGNSATVNFGALGYCIRVAASSDACTKAQVGYQLPPALINLAEQTGVLSNTAENAIEATTKALILHPIACGVSFLAFLIAAVSDRLGFICAALIAFVAMLCAAVAMVLDIVLFYVLKAYLEKNNIGSLVSVSYSVGTWTTVTAFCCLFIGMFFTLCACITDRRRRRRDEKY
ncbi:hypothetical protein JCM10296v2_001148 [Rhodotorula toruloides]